MRSSRPSAPSNLTVSQLVQRRTDASRDIEELAAQVEVGEIDPATAARLRAGYEQELAETEDSLADSAEDAFEPDLTRPKTPMSRSTQRSLVGAASVVGLFTLAIFFIGGDTIPTRQGVAAGTADQATATSVVSDAAWLAEMEDVVAANPDNIAFRVALADVYFRELNYSGALRHYLGILESDPDPSQESEALGRVGWMAFATDQLESAERYLRTSLVVDPLNIEGELFLAYVLFYGFDDAAGAVPLLENVLAASGLTAAVRLDAEDMLAQALAQQAGATE